MATTPSEALATAVHRSATTDAWLRERWRAHQPGDNFALVAVGGYGAGRLAAGSDLDLLVIRPKRASSESLAAVEAFWYDVWDSGRKLGHAIRTNAETLALAREDLATATALLSARHLDGNVDLTAALATTARRQWIDRRGRLLSWLAEDGAERHSTGHSVAFDLEPDLKSAKGGLRDAQALGWLAAAGVDVAEPVLAGLSAAVDQLWSVRVTLHDVTGRAGDVLRLQDQDAVAAQLGLADADVLMGLVATAGRRIAWAADEAWYDYGGGARIAGNTTGTDSLADLFTLTVQATDVGERLERDTLAGFAQRAQHGEWHGDWSERARDAFVDLLGRGDAALTAIEALDHEGLLGDAIPELRHTRSLPQRNAYHRFTVDRHLFETAFGAARLVDSVDRPDLLLIGALLHDVGKGLRGDHTERGVELIGRIGPRLGFSEPDTECLQTLCRHHLLLADTATRRDLADPRTIQQVAAAVGDEQTLRLLAALTEADSLATGPTAWSPWKAKLVHQLVSAVAATLDGGPDRVVLTGFPTARHEALLAAGEEVIEAHDGLLTLLLADRPGLLARVTGTLAIAGLDVLDASILTVTSPSGVALALQELHVQNSVDEPVDWPLVISRIRQALAGRLAVSARLARRAQAYRGTVRAGRQLPPKVEIISDASDTSTVVEVTCPDRVGLLHDLTAAISSLDLDISCAKVATLGDAAVDTFYLHAADGGPVVDEDQRRELQVALHHVID